MDNLTTQDVKKVTKVAVVDHTSNGQGRVFEKHSLDIELQLQDDGRTLKVFVKDRGVDLL